MSNRPSPNRRYRSHLLALEPRMMFDAAAAIGAQDVIADNATSDHGVRFAAADTHDAPPIHAEPSTDTATPAPTPAIEHTQDVHTPVTTDEARAPDARYTDSRVAVGLGRHDESSMPAIATLDDAAEPAASTHEIVFIDTSVADYQQLAAEWANRGQVILIDGTKDGIDQMRAALAGQNGITAIHIVSHGSEGAFWLGTTKVDTASITGDLASSLGAIGRSLAAGGDILIYGCDFAEGADGAAALAAFADATHADVAASTDTTGFGPRGGDWVLESHRGTIEASELSTGDWVHTLDPNTPVPISVAVDSLSVKDGTGATVFSSTLNNYNNNAARSGDVGVGAVATWANAATYQGHSVDLKATIVSLSTGDAVQFNRVTGTGTGADDPTFLLRDLTGTTANNTTAAVVQIRWELVDHTTGEALPADVRFTIADIDGIGGNPNTRESVSASTDNLAYYTADKNSDIRFDSTLNRITASGTADENNPVGATLTPQSAASFDWTKVSSFTLTYTLAPNATTTQAQFYHDGDADFVYNTPVYVSIPRLDLDGNDSTATGNDAHFTFTENGPGVGVVNSDIVVSNPMDINSITSATVKLTNYQAGDTFAVGTLPGNISYTIGAVTNGTITVTLTGLGSEQNYEDALKAILFSNTSDTPSTTQRVLEVSFSNNTLTSATAISRIDVVPVNDAPTAKDDTATTAEDTAVTINVLGNDTDPDGDPLTVTGASALHGTVVRNADDTLTYTPGANYNGSDTITYTISDGNGGTDTATVAITITPVNDAPNRVGTLPAQSTTDAATVTYATSGGFADVDGDALSYSATGLPAGLTINASTGVISGTVNRSASQTGGGNYTVVVTARDPSNASTTQSFTIAVANPAPTAVNDTATTTEDTAVTIAVLTNDTDADGDPLTVTGATALHGTVVRNADNTLTYTPNANYNGLDTISYTISDGQGGTSSATVAVTITPVNDAPTPVGTLPARSTPDAATVSYATAGGFTDVDGDILTYSATGLPAGLTIDTATGIISGTVDRAASQANGGTYTVVVTAREPSNASTTQSLMIAVANPAPTASNDTATTAEDTPVTIPVLVNDTDPDGDPLTVTAASALHGTVVSNGDGTVTYTPDADYSGSDTVTYTISDGQGGSSTAMVAVTITPVNDTPRAVPVPLVYTTTDGSVVNVSVTPAFTDPDGDTLTYGANGLPAGLTIDPATGAISGTIDRSASQVAGGRYTVVLTATDPSNLTVTQTGTLIVTDPAPIATNDAATTAENTPATIPVLANDSDPDRDPLSVTAASALHGAVVRNPDGTITYTPDADFNGDDTVTYTISDGEGGTSTATVAITVTPVNDAPVARSGLPDRGTLDGSAVSYPTAGGFADVDGDALTYAASGLPAGLSIDAATGVISGTVDRSASQANGGHYVVTVTASDASTTAATQRFAIDVANPVPTANDDATTTHVDRPVDIAVLANDTDPDGDPLSVTGAILARGSVAVLADGTLRYTPPAGYVGRDTITYTISDGQGGTATATVTIDITNGAPTAPTVTGFAANDGQPIALPVGARFVDADGDPLTFTATGLPPGLSIDPATGTITGTIDHAASGINGGVYDSVITASDGHGGTASSTLHWTIANPAPTAAADIATTAEDTPVTIPVLANDVDPDGDPLIIVSASAVHGTVAINPDGTITYTPGANFNGSDTIVYMLDDGQGGRATASVAVTVTPVDDAPSSAGLPPRMTADAATVAFPAAPAFTDIDGDTLTYSVVGLPAGLSIDPATGIVSGTIAVGGASGGPAGDGVYRAIVTATDPAGHSATAAFDWTVSQAAPNATDDRATTVEDTPVTISVLANDTDPDGDPLTIVDAVADHGTVAIVDGALVYTPAKDFTGTATISYMVGNPLGHRATATVTVTVTPANDAPVAAPVPAMSGCDGQSVTLDIGSFFGDPDGDALRFTATGLPAGLSVDPATGRISGTLDGGASQVPGGIYHVVVTATDPSGASVDSRFDWTIANLAPVATDDRATTPEETATSIAVLANDTDPDGDTLTVVDASAAHGSVAINADGTLSYTPNADFNGSDVIVYTISDGNGGRASASVIVTVTPVNDAPVAIVPAPLAQTGPDGAPVAIDAAPLFRDPDGDPLVYTASGLPAGLSIDPDSGVIRGTLDRSASQVAGGVYTITLTATDPSGAATSVALAFTATNPAPVATDDTAVTDRDTGVIIPVLVNDRDSDGDPLTVTAASASHGSVTINADGTLAYTPDAGFVGDDTIAYTISDGEGGTANTIVRVTVAPVNDAPIAIIPNPAAQFGLDGSPVSIDLTPWFRDPNGDALTYTASGLPAGLSIDPATGAITGTLDRSASQLTGGVYPIIVSASDPSGAAESVTVSLTVTDPAPVAVDDAARTNQDAGLVIPVLANDRDPDGDPLTVTSATAANGTATINAEGTLNYVPGANFTGIDTIRYTISDGQGGTATAIVTITVDPVNHAPVVPGRDPIDATGGRPITIDVLTGTNDPDGDSLAITSATSVNGVVTINRDGTLGFTPALGFVGSTTIAYTVSDGRGGVTTGTIVVRVADGRGADIQELLRIGQVSFRDPTPSLATIALPADGIVRNPLSLLGTAEGIRPLNTTTIGEQPVGDAVEAIRSLRGTDMDLDSPITTEVARLNALRDQRDAGDKLFDHRWGDFLVKGLTGFSAAADKNACIMVDSVVRGGAIYLEVRDTATEGQRAPIRSVDVRLAHGGRAPEWLKVDHRGLAIVERGADMDELHLIVRVTRTDGRTDSIPIVVQGETGEVELDRQTTRHTTAAKLDATLNSPRTATAHHAARLASHFE